MRCADWFMGALLLAMLVVAAPALAAFCAPPAPPLAACCTADCVRRPACTPF